MFPRALPGSPSASRTPGAHAHSYPDQRPLRGAPQGLRRNAAGVCSLPPPFMGRLLRALPGAPGSGLLRSVGPAGQRAMGGGLRPGGVSHEAGHSPSASGADSSGIGGRRRADAPWAAGRGGQFERAGLGRAVARSLGHSPADWTRGSGDKLLWMLHSGCSRPVPSPPPFKVQLRWVCVQPLPRSNYGIWSAPGEAPRWQSLPPPPALATGICLLSGDLPRLHRSQTRPLQDIRGVWLLSLSSVLEAHPCWSRVRSQCHPGPGWGTSC